ncbi:unnamed protein product, partial [Hapterophycus canaliculatus]
LRGGVGLERDLTFSHIPKVLKGCLHTICQNCAEDRLQRSTDASSITCPLCGVLTSDITRTSALQDNIVALQDLNRMNSHCDFCDDVAQASHVCNECDSLLCAFHVNAHAISRGTKSHHLVALTDRGSMLSIHEISHRVPITCARHNDVPAKLFCSEPCGTIMCHDCSAAEHAGHDVSLADSEEVEVIHRTDLTRRAIALGHRLAGVRGALDAVEAVRTGVEHHTRMAERAATQAFQAIRAAVDERERDVLQNLRADRAQKSQDLKAQLEKLDQTVSAYKVALKMTDTSLEYLHGNQLLAMKSVLRECLDANEAGFSSLELEPCVQDHVEFEHDVHIAKSVGLMMSRLGYLRNSPGSGLRAKEVPHSPEKEVHASAAGNHNIHFTLAAVVGVRPPEATFASPTDTVVVEIRDGSESDFLESGKAGPVIGRVVLHTKFRGAKNLTYESEHFFESLSQPKRLEGEEEKQDVSTASSNTGDGLTTAIPAVRFTKTLRVLSRRVEQKPA